MAKKAEHARVTHPENLRIGGTYYGDEIREINERCMTRPEPHVHLLTTKGTACLSFSPSHTTYDPRVEQLKSAMRRLKAADALIQKAGEKLKRVMA